MKAVKKGDKKEKGVLYLCATPIGNLEDITLRALRVLKEVDLIVSENPSETIKLLNHYRIKKKLFSFPAALERKKTDMVISYLKEGKNLALVSDRGMPGLSDPGFRLIKKAIEEGIEIEVLPGASSVLAALIISGLPTSNFAFYGFLPKKKGRRKTIEKIAQEEKTIVLFESPHRIKKTLGDLNEVLGERKAALVRELTKFYQEVIRGNLTEILSIASEKKLKGEIVLVIEGKKSKEQKYLSNT